MAIFGLLPGQTARPYTFRDKSQGFLINRAVVVTEEQAKQPVFLFDAELSEVVYESFYIVGARCFLDTMRNENEIDCAPVDNNDGSKRSVQIFIEHRAPAKYHFAVRLYPKKGTTASNRKDAIRLLNQSEDSLKIALLSAQPPQSQQ